MAGCEDCYAFRKRKCELGYEVSTNDSGVIVPVDDCPKLYNEDEYIEFVTKLLVDEEFNE